MANDILGGIINLKYQAETMLVFVESYKEYSRTLIFACKVSNLAKIPLVLALTFQKFLSLYYKNIAI